MAIIKELTKFVQVLPSRPIYDADGNKIPDAYTEKKTLWGWFFPIENYWTITETQQKLNELEIKIYQSIDWKETVTTFSEIAIKYPTPAEGWTVSVSDTNTIYRYDASSGVWIKLFESSTELASAVRNGLMSSAGFNKLAGIEDQANKYIHPSTHPATMITTDANNRFVSDALINKWNTLVTFPGFAGTGGYFGTTVTAARTDHGHQILNEIEKLNFKCESTDMGWIGVASIGEDHSKMTFYLGDNINTAAQDWFEWIGMFGGSDISMMRLDWNALYFKGTPVSLSGHKHAMSDISGLSLDWNAITGKPSTFTPSAHSHAMSDISGLSLDWNAITGKPSTFTPSAHSHSEYSPTSHQHTNLTATGYNAGQYDLGLVFNVDGDNRFKLQCVSGGDGLNYKNSISCSYANHATTADNVGGITVQQIARRDAANTFTQYCDFLGGAGNSGSDMRYKTILSSSIETILPSLMQLSIFDYVWNKENEENRNTFGVNADQLIEIGGVFEKIVHTRNDEEKTKWVEYDRLGLIAIKGLQELNTRLTDENKKLRNALTIICDKIGLNPEDLSL